MVWVVNITSGLHFTPGESTPGTYWIYWVSPKAGLDTDAIGRILLHLSGIEPPSHSCPVHSQTLYWLSYSGSRKVRVEWGKAVPLHAMEALGGERRYSAYSFLTSAPDGVIVVSIMPPGHVLPPGKGPPVPLDRRLGLSQSWSGQRLEEKSLCLSQGSNPDRRVIQSVVRHCTDWATPAPGRWEYICQKGLRLRIVKISCT
jgi:hypothetical protein